MSSEQAACTVYVIQNTESIKTYILKAVDNETNQITHTHFSPIKIDIIVSRPEINCVAGRKET